MDADLTTTLCDKVKEMQRFSGLPPSGKLTQDTLAFMKRPRCGLSDVEPFGKTIRWKKRTVSYRFDSVSQLRSSHHPVLEHAGHRGIH